jgi:hypothetical protein
VVPSTSGSEASQSSPNQSHACTLFAPPPPPTTIIATIIDASSPSPLAQGTFAKVYKAKCIEDGPHLNELVAIKALKLEAFMSSLDDIIVRTLAPPSLASPSLPGTT